MKAGISLGTGSRLDTRRRRAKYVGSIVIALMIAIVFLTPSNVVAVASASPELQYGDFVSTTCLNGAIYLNATLRCHDQSNVNIPLCGVGTCYYYLTETMDTGHSFSEYGVTGWACLGQPGGHCYTCWQSPTGSDLWVYISKLGTYSGSFTLNPSSCSDSYCTPPAISNYHAWTVAGYRQEWIYWNYTGSGPLAPSFSWNPTGGGPLANPEIWAYETSSNGTSRVNLNDLTAGTSYNY